MKKLALVIAVVTVALVFSHATTPVAVAPTSSAVSTSQRPAPHRAISVPAAPTLELGSTKLESPALADRETELVANGRRAWRFVELAPDLGPRMNVKTADGADFVVATTDAILVRRDDGTIYIGWMNSGTGALADLERPGERIENAIAVTPVVDVVLAPAAVAVMIGGKQVRTVTAATFAAAAKLTFRDKHDSAAPAIAVDNLVSFESNGEHVTAAPPTPTARAIVYMNRRERFKLAWLDPSGTPIGDKRGEITQITLAR